MQTRTNPTRSRTPLRRHAGRAALAVAVALAVASPASADIIDDLSDFFGMSPNEEGGYEGPCNVETLVVGGKAEAPAQLWFYARRETYDPVTNHDFASATSAAFSIDGAPIASGPGGLPGQFVATRTFGLTEAGHHELKVVLSMPGGFTCTHAEDVFVHPKSVMVLTAFPHDDDDPLVWDLHAGLLVDWENLSKVGSYEWDFGGGTPLTPPFGSWGYPSDVTVAFPGPGNYHVTVTGQVFSQGRTVSLTRDRWVAVDGPSAGAGSPGAGVDVAMPAEGLPADATPVPPASVPAAAPTTVEAGAPVSAPTVTVPAVTVPAVTVPTVTVPAVTVPAVTIPAVTVPTPPTSVPAPGGDEPTLPPSVVILPDLDEPVLAPPPTVAPLVTVPLRDLPVLVPTTVGRWQW